jgi:hypothetical protein
MPRMVTWGFPIQSLPLLNAYRASSNVTVTVVDLTKTDTRQEILLQIPTFYENSLSLPRKTNRGEDRSSEAKKKVFANFTCELALEKQIFSTALIEIPPEVQCPRCPHIRPTPYCNHDRCRIVNSTAIPHYQF